MDFKDKLNNILLSNIGVVIMTGTEELLAFPERKEVMENDWAEENGGDYDLSSPKFKDKEVTLKMAILADDNVQFWQYYNTLFAELKKRGNCRSMSLTTTKPTRCFIKSLETLKKF